MLAGSYCSSCQLQPWSTVRWPQGAERPFRELEKGGKKDRFAKASKTQEFLKCPASPERTRRGIHFPKGWNRPLQLRFTKPWEKTPTNSHNLQLTQSWQNSEPICPAELTRAQRSGAPAPIPPTQRAALGLTWLGCRADVAPAGPAAGKSRPAWSSGTPSLGGSVTCGPKQPPAPCSSPAPQVQAPLSCIAAGAEHPLYAQPPLPVPARPPAPPCPRACALPPRGRLHSPALPAAPGEPGS